MTSLQDLQFSNTNFGFGISDEDDLKTVQKVHLRLQKRNNRKCWTIVEHIPTDLNLKKILKYMKKELSCNGHLKYEESKSDDPKDKGEPVLVFQGDHRDTIKSFLIEKKICASNNEIVVHGY